MINKKIIRILLVIVALTLWATMTAAPHNLQDLDRMLNENFIGKRQHIIDSIRNSVSKESNSWSHNYTLAGAYSDFNVDSALHYINLAEKYAPDEKSRQKSLLRKGAIYNGSLMMYKEAADIFNQLSADPSDPSYSADYYTFGVQLFKNLEEYSPEEDIRKAYASKKRTFRDSVLSFYPRAFLIEANNYLDDGNISKALSILLPEVNGKEFKPSNGAVYHVIAKAYEMQGNTDKEIEYLTLAARADIANGVREYIALPRLAFLLYQKGDIDRAYKYMLRSYEDARACNARIRLIDMSETMAIISAAHNARSKAAGLWMILFIILLFLSLVVLGILFFYSKRRNHLLHQSRLRLEEANSLLENNSTIRDKNARRFMLLSLEFMDKLNDYRLHLLKIASKRNFDKLYDAISSTASMDQDSEIFYRNFDSAFLEQFPNFIEDLNKLLRPEEQISLPDSNVLTTDLRILALMKLGITESSEISKLLHCSQSTVYNYRTKFRSKAIDKDKFVRIIFNQPTTDTPTI